MRLQVQQGGHLSSLHCAISVPPHSSTSSLFNLPIYTAINQTDHHSERSITQLNLPHCLAAQNASISPISMKGELYTPLHSIYCSVCFTSHYLLKHSKILQSFVIVCLLFMLPFLSEKHLPCLQVSISKRNFLVKQRYYCSGLTSLWTSCWCLCLLQPTN